MAIGVHDNYPLGWLACREYPEPAYTASPSPMTTGEHRTVTVFPGPPSIQEQMGTDPISKLAAAIERLADALREGTRD